MTSITISSEVLAQELGGETVLLDQASESYFGLDAVSTRAWQLLQTGASQAEVVDALFERFRSRLQPASPADAAGAEGGGQGDAESNRRR